MSALWGGCGINEPHYYSLPIEQNNVVFLFLFYFILIYDCFKRKLDLSDSFEFNLFLRAISESFNTHIKHVWHADIFMIC